MPKNTPINNPAAAAERRALIAELLLKEAPELAREIDRLRAAVRYLAKECDPVRNGFLTEFPEMRALLECPPSFLRASREGFRWVYRATSDYPARACLADWHEVPL